MNKMANLAQVLRGKLNSFKASLPSVVGEAARGAFVTNFQKSGFFSQAWIPSKRSKKGYKTLIKSGALLRDVNRFTVSGSGANAVIRFSSSLPYAVIHNEGGVINHSGGTKYSPKRGSKLMRFRKNSYSGRVAGVTGAHSITMPERRFIGDAPALRSAIQRAASDELKRVFNS